MAGFREEGWSGSGFFTPVSSAFISFEPRNGHGDLPDIAVCEMPPTHRLSMIDRHDISNHSVLQ